MQRRRRFDFYGPERLALGVGFLSFSVLRVTQGGEIHRIAPCYRSWFRTCTSKQKRPPARISAGELWIIKSIRQNAGYFPLLSPPHPVAGTHTPPPPPPFLPFVGRGRSMGCRFWPPGSTSIQGDPRTHKPIPPGDACCSDHHPFPTQKRPGVLLRVFFPSSPRPPPFPALYSVQASGPPRRRVYNHLLFIQAPPTYITSSPPRRRARRPPARAARRRRRRQHADLHPLHAPPALRHGHVKLLRPH